MPRGLSYWSYREVVTVLKNHGFTLHHTKGSHYYYRGIIDKTLRMTCVPYHGRTALAPKTLAEIITQSGIKKDVWMKRSK